ncbi:hypothetical protein TNCV_163781 [Trichonephila clavipes]|nr:hypothetical protein TNCV_163781 [Trichonephila clavipes]
MRAAPQLPNQANGRILSTNDLMYISPSTAVVPNPQGHGPSRRREQKNVGNPIIQKDKEYQQPQMSSQIDSKLIDIRDTDTNTRHLCIQKSFIFYVSLFVE